VNPFAGNILAATCAASVWFRVPEGAFILIGGILTCPAAVAS
jgi:hypothetical protein